MSLSDRKLRSLKRLGERTRRLRRKYPDVPTYQRYSLSPTQRVVMLLMGSREERFWAMFHGLLLQCFKRLFT